MIETNLVDFQLLALGIIISRSRSVRFLFFNILKSLSPDKSYEEALHSLNFQTPSQLDFYLQDPE